MDHQLKLIIFILAVFVFAGISPGLSYAQSTASVDPYNNLKIETVHIQITNPSSDKGINERVRDTVRKRIALFPGARFSKERFSFILASASRLPDIAAIDYDLSFGRRGGLDITVLISLTDVAQTDEGRGMFLTGDASDAPVLYDRNGTHLRFKFESLALYYGNRNAWYGRPDAMLAGNPLVEGTPSGSGYEHWVEGSLHYGLYGITPITKNVYSYAGLSAITTGSYGQELFTDKTRSFTGVEDGYVGIIGGQTDAQGNRFAYNFSVGRQRFTLANGFLIVNTAAGGHDRAALQANTRWAADNLALGQFFYNDTKFEVFYLNPDELPIVDSNTRIAGLNLETRLLEGLDIGFSALTVPQSNFAYFSPAGTQFGTRDGLRVYDMRFTYSPKPANEPGPFFGGEIAVQRNNDINMEAEAGYLELGYSFPDKKWSPTVSYRLGYFSGDDPDTDEYERWDPLYSGGTGEQWVQGANHFKVVQDSNVLAHRLQARFRPSPKMELVPQFWIFSADEENNIGGNPALSVLSGKDYGIEANLTAKWFVSRNTYVHGHIAYTMPGDDVEQALNDDAENWLSVMLFIRHAF